MARARVVVELGIEKDNPKWEGYRLVEFESRPWIEVQGSSLRIVIKGVS